jgi:hypothetical protein
MKTKDIFQRFEEFIIRYFVLDGHDPLQHKYWYAHSIIIRFFTKFFVLCFIAWITILSWMACIGGSQAEIYFKLGYSNGTITQESYNAFTNIIMPIVIFAINLTIYVIGIIAALYIGLIIYFLIRWEYRKKKDEL